MFGARSGNNYVSSDKTILNKKRLNMNFTTDNTDQARTIVEIRENANQNSTSVTDPDYLLFDELYETYAPKIYTRCLALLKNEEVTKEATQYVFLKAYLHLSTLKNKVNTASLIHALTYHNILDIIKKANKDIALFSNDIIKKTNLAENISDEKILAIEFQSLKSVLDQIPVGDKAVLLMKYQDDMSLDEMSDILECPQISVIQKLESAKRNLVFVIDNF